MNATSLASMAYARSAAPTRTPRDTEYELFARITHRLRREMARLDNASGFGPMAEALWENTRLWTTLAADVAEPGNALPQSLRAGIFQLAEFTRAHTRKVLAGLATAEILIEINTSVMRGLRGHAHPPNPGAGPTADQPERQKAESPVRTGEAGR